MALYRRSVLKQQKFQALRAIVGDVSGKRCLDVGGGNGVISVLLRGLGGDWHSADLDERTVDPVATVTYLRSFAELLDILLNAGCEIRNTPEERSRKGTVITQEDWSQRPGSMRLFALLHPAFRLFVQGDHILFRHPGYRLLVRAARVAAHGAANERPAPPINHGRTA